jgi:hypothetical protein
MTRLDSWLSEATRHLSKDSANKVRAEIRQHYEDAREAAIASCADIGEADRAAIAALGDARMANRQYRRVLLTSTEARLLRTSACEVRVLWSRPSRRWLLLLLPLAALSGAAAYLLAGNLPLASALLAAGISMGMICAAPYLPVYTPARGRAFRSVRWAMLLAVFVLALGPSWLLFTCIWPVLWIEGTRVSIRRKLPVAEWPKQLYL